YIRAAREPELGVADQRIDGGVRHSIEDVGRVDAIVEIDAVAPWERPRDAGVQRELCGPSPGVASGVAPRARRWRGVGSRIQIVPIRDGLSGSPRQRGSNGARIAGATGGRQIVR